MTDSGYAEPPFDNPRADIILRSCDGVDFRVFKPFLSLASPFFDTAFDIPQPVQPSKDQEVLAVIPLTENSKTLDTFLRFCYPCTLTEDPKIEILKDALDVLDAAVKYSFGRIELKVRRAIINKKILEEEPLRCFAIVYRGHMREETLLAARYTLTQPLVPPWFPEIDLLTTTELLSLLLYHKQCGEAVYALRLNLSWITAHYGSLPECSWLSGLRYDRFGDVYRCGCPRPGSPAYMVFNVSLQWWENFMEETFIALREMPCKDTVKASAEKTVCEVKVRNCPTCSAKITDGMRGFVELLSRKIEETVARIELELSF